MGFPRDPRVPWEFPACASLYWLTYSSDAICHSWRQILWTHSFD